MAIQRPTLQARKGFDDGLGPGISAPYGYSPGYPGFHNGQDYFWLSAASAQRLGMTQAQGYEVYPVVSGAVYAVNDVSLGTGLYQQINATTRAYWWHLATRKTGSFGTTTVIGTMGNTGTSAGSSRHLHFEVRVAPYGFSNRVNPEPYFTAKAVLEAHQRQVLSTLPVRRRVAPSTTAAEAGEPLEPGEVGNFNGWIKGESVSGNNVWYRGISGHWFWSGGFTNTGTLGLVDLNPVSAPKITRTVKPAVANVRNLPTTSGTEVIATLDADSVVEVTGYTKGLAVSGIDTWFRLAAGWAWAGGFTSQSTTGLALLQSGLPANPGFQLDPTLWQGKTPDVEIAKWVGSPNFNYRTPVVPKTHFTEHWMDGTLAGTDQHFQIAGEVTEARLGTGVASTFGVGQTEVHQYVKMKDYHHADGNAASNASGVSIEHEGGPNRPITDAVYALSARLHVQVMKSPLWGGGDRLALGVNVKKHSDVAATTCPGTLDVERLIREVNVLLDEMDAPTEPTPIPTPTPEPEPAADTLKAFLTELGVLIAKYTK